MRRPKTRWVRTGPAEHIIENAAPGLNAFKRGGEVIFRHIKSGLKVFQYDHPSDRLRLDQAEELVSSIVSTLPEGLDWTAEVEELSAQPQHLLACNKVAADFRAKLCHNDST